MSEVPPNESGQQPVPLAWRASLRAVADAFASGNYRLEPGIAGVEPLAPETSAQIRANVQSYGAELVPLPEVAWESSVCAWNGQDWEVLVDLWTVEEGPSDLVLHAYVQQSQSGSSIRVHSVYVP